MSVLWLRFVTISWPGLLPRAQGVKPREQQLFPGVGEDAGVQERWSCRTQAIIGDTGGWGCRYSHCNSHKNCAVGFSGWWFLNTFRNFFRWDAASLWERLPGTARHASLCLSLHGLWLQTKAGWNQKICFVGLAQIHGCTVSGHTLCFIIFNCTKGI